MKTKALRILWPVPFTLLIVWALFPSRQRARADEPGVMLGVPEKQLDIDLAPHALPEPVLAVEVLAALESQSPRVLEETMRPWANAIADQADNRRDALRMAFVVSDESHFAPEVLDYRCNHGGYRSCDHGNAVGPFQMWDRSLMGASPEEHVRKAYARMRVDPYAWATFKRARAQADAWVAGYDADAPADTPVGDLVRIAKAPPPLVIAAREYLAEDAPFGSRKDVEIDGTPWALVVEWHYHPAGFVGGPIGWHKGVSVFAVRAHP